MERETLLGMLVMIFGGLTLQLPVIWPEPRRDHISAIELERRWWLALCSPAVPALAAAAWLCGWALTQPDPVRGPLDPWVVIAAWLPFGLLFIRAAARGCWALLRRPPECGVSTVGLLQPQVVFSPFLAKQLQDEVIRAALAHERAHAAHRDPLRIWVAQLLTDLQWPWPAAERRLREWLDALELARDEEARARGTDGAELAAAVLASARFLKSMPSAEQESLTGPQLAHAGLLGGSLALKHRVSRLLGPLHPCAGGGSRPAPVRALMLILAGVLGLSLVLGAVYGAGIVRPLLALTA
jgi:hypothetical protein